MISSGIINVLRQWNVNIRQFKRENIKFIAGSITRLKKSGSGYGPVAGFLKHDKEPSGPIKVENVFIS
jgi:hypothetical protein